VDDQERVKARMKATERFLSRFSVQTNLLLFILNLEVRPK
jgi:hypothetical protein